MIGNFKRIHQISNHIFLDCFMDNNGFLGNFVNEITKKTLLPRIQHEKKVVFLIDFYIRDYCVIPRPLFVSSCYTTWIEGNKHFHLKLDYFIE